MIAPVLEELAIEYDVCIPEVPEITSSRKNEFAESMTSNSPIINSEILRNGF